MRKLEPIIADDVVWGRAYYEMHEVDAVIAEKDRTLEFAKALTLKDIEIIKEKDKEIAELKKKLMPCLNGDCILTCEVVEKYGKENAELKQKLEDAQATAYAESVDAGMRERRLKRALYKACANWAKAYRYPSFRKFEARCLKIAEEYK